MSPQNVDKIFRIAFREAKKVSKFADEYEKSLEEARSASGIGGFGGK